MLRNFETDKNFRPLYDCCVIGGGPAGITLALRLAAAGHQVVLVEGGATEYAERSQNLYRCHTTGRNAYVETTRQRMLGGTSNHWSGRCRPFEPSDFSVAPPGKLPGWPIAYTEIERFLPEAMRILDLPIRDFEKHNPPLDGEDFAADRYLLSSPTRFAKKYATALRETPGLDVFVNCNCVDLVFHGKTRRLSSVTVVDYDGGRGSIAAKTYVLAMGAIENARQLLCSASLVEHDVVKENGIVGSCFMEHLNVDLGTFVLRDGQDKGERQYYTTDSFIRRHRIGKGNVSLSLVSEVKSYGRSAAVKDFFKNIACSLGVADKVQFITTFNCPGDGTIGTLIEQLPRRQSRIMLTQEKDLLGMRKAGIHWDLGEEDIHTIRTIGMEVAKRFADAGLGYVKLNERLVGNTEKLHIHPHAHHMGTTRMAANPEAGVVDANCKVFGTENLYIAGSSIFATGGACNPTMPIIQFVLRLAEYLDHRLSRK